MSVWRWDLLFVCERCFVHLASSWVGFLPACSCVCFLLLPYFNTGSIFLRLISQPSSSSAWFLDLHFSPVWKSYFPLSGRKRKVEYFYPLLVRWDDFNNLNKNTLSLMLLKEHLFSFTFWMRVGGGNWRGAENCFSVTEPFWWKCITWSWKDISILPTVPEKILWPLILLCSIRDVWLSMSWEMELMFDVCGAPQGGLLNCDMILEPSSYLQTLLVPQTLP